MRSTFRAPLLLAAMVLAVAAPPAAGQRAADLFAGFQTKSDSPVEVDAETLEVYEEGKERIAVFTGNVVVRRGETTLRAASIKLRQDLQGNAEAFSKIEAEGGIVVTSRDQKLTGKAAVVDMKLNSIVVSGGVVLSQGTNVLTGTRLVVDLATGRARLEGDAVRGVFTPSQ
jgi:lipopolysaccharide export system protein LptA